MSRKGLILLLFRRKKDRDFARLIKKYTGFFPKNLGLYRQAFVHNSSINRKDSDKLSNERLEFLGDAVIDLVVAEFVFRKFSSKGEGYLTEMRSKIVSREQLSFIAAKLGFEKLLVLNESMKNTRNINLYGIAGNALEAFIGAIYLDCGFVKARKFVIKKLIKPFIDIEKLDSLYENYKSILLQWGQKNRKIIDFRLIEEYSDKNVKFFKVGLYIDEELLVDATNLTKKKAEQMASEKAIAHLQLNIWEFKLT